MGNLKEYLKVQDIEKSLANLPQLTFEITDACNLKCTYCSYGEFYNDYDERGNKTLAVEKAIRIIDYLAGYWNSERNASAMSTLFISFYGGEPLLNMPFIKTIVEHITLKVKCPYRNFSFSMTTNAMLLDRHMNYLVEHDFFLLISLDGNEKNNSYRIDMKGSPAFSRIIKNVDALKEKYPDYFEKKVNFNAVLHNKNSVEEIYRFFKEKYNKTPMVGELNNVGIREDKRALFMKTYRNSEESLYQSEHYEKIEQEMYMNTPGYQNVLLYLHQYSGFVFRDYTDLIFDRSGEEMLPTGTCIPFNKKMFVTVNGKILPCERIGHQFALGEITDHEIRLDPVGIADKYNRYLNNLSGQCLLCKIRKSCIQCIYNIENIEGIKPVCHGFTNENRFRNFVNAQMKFLARNPEAYSRIMNEVIVR